MFALSWYRIKEQTLGLARDKHGEKPLFYYHGKKMFRYGSELASLVDDEYSVDETSVREYLSYGFHLGDITYFESYRMLGNGNYLEFDLKNNSLIQETWYNKNASVSIKAESFLIDSLVASLKRRLRSDVPVGLFLSSGTDSGIIAGILPIIRHLPKFLS